MSGARLSGREWNAVSTKLFEADAELTYRPLPGEIIDGVVYPSGDGEPMSENDPQFTAITETAATLRDRYVDRSDVYIAGDMFVYYRRGRNDVRVAPDVFVAFGARGSHKRLSWIIWNEGGVVPAFVLEVAAPKSWERDAVAKREIYARLGVREYWRFDPIGDLFYPVLVGEELVDGEYEPLDVYTDSAGILRGYSSALALDVCVRSDSALRFYDPASREWLLSPGENYIGRLEAEAQVSAERAARIAAEAEIERLRSLLRGERE